MSFRQSERMSLVCDALKRSGSQPNGDARSREKGLALRGSVLHPLLVAEYLALVIALLAAVSTLRAANFSATRDDTAFLDDLEQRGVRYFVEHCDARTGLANDRAPADGSPAHAPASIATTGFALTAWCIADSHGWVAPGDAQREARRALQFIATQYPQEHGWFYHYADAATGQRAWHSEASTIDTALFLQGALFAREYLHDAETTALVNQIYARIDWQWALNGGTTLTHGWRPEGGFLPYRWDSYSELMGMYLLGLGAPGRALPEQAWGAWRRAPLAQFEGRNFIQCGPLFTHQYAEGWFDFRGRHDAYADYWQNSVDATLAQRAWSAAQSNRFHHWSAEMWGLTASDGPHGYMGWGTPGPGDDESDGTLVPCAPGGSLPFAPRECLTALEQMRTAGGAHVWGRYGFVDAFNPETGWASPDVIGIDVGITLVMAENLRSGLVWREFMRAPEVQRGMTRAGFTSPQHLATPIVAMLAK